MSEQWYYAKLSEPIPKEMVKDFTNKLYYISENLAGFELVQPTRDCVRFRLLSDDGKQVSIITSHILHIATKIFANSFLTPEYKVVVRNNIQVPFTEDPHPLLQTRGELFTFGKGRWGLGPLLMKLYRFFESELCLLAQKLGLTEHQFPALIGADTLDYCRYLRSFPHAINLVAHLREDLEIIQNFADHTRWTGKNLTSTHEYLAPIECLLSPAVCFHYYAWLHNSKHNSPLSITALGKCFRYESGSMSGLERLWDFTMREFIFVGSADYVLSQRQRVIEESSVLLNRWGLAYEIKSATDPFFIEDYSAKAFQLAFDLKYEIRAQLPYKKDTLAIGSFNYHQNFFGRSFNISDGQGEPLHTSCTGFGFERMLLALVAQYGVDPLQWPEPIRNKI